MKQEHKDIINYIESIPFGDVSLKVKRVNKKTVEVTTVGRETLRYVNNQEALDDLFNMFKNLLETSFSGDVNVKLELKDGQIKLLSLYNEKQTHYKD